MKPAGAVLAVVQKLGGAFLWFPSKPEAIQQWEGMSFSSSFKVTKRITRNQHFDTDFACWSEVGKLVLGLTWTLILRYEIHQFGGNEKELMDWAKGLALGYQIDLDGGFGKAFILSPVDLGLSEPS